MSRKVVEAKEVSVSSIEELEQSAKELSQSFSERQIVLLNGPMGAGKTQWVRCLSQGLDVCSPTFSLHNRYLKSDSHIDHLDLYRIEDDDELESIGFWDLFSQEKAWIFIEWAERVRFEDMPFHWNVVSVTLSFADEPNKRNILIEKYS